VEIMPVRQEFPVAGICASAGGLDAFKRFFGAMPGESGIAFVLVPHLDPNHQSLMPELIARQTAMAVVEAAEGMRVEANCVYIIPPNKYMTIVGGVLRLTGPVERRGAQTPIDPFLRSLAEDQQEKAICVILSGTGSHGTLGLKAVKANGGMAMVQESKTAEYDRMPQSAIATGLADYILPVEQMPQALIQYAQHFYINGGEKATGTSEAPDYLNQIVSLLRARTKFDFRFYRKKMLVRRIERRMGLKHYEELPSYLALLRENSDELKQLAQDLLISVTNFFRDVDAFRIMETEVIAPLVQAKEPDTPIRVWVPACSTGEEPYSLGMLLLDQLAVAQKSCRVQIFATDVDEDALEVARQAIYPESISADIAPERLERFFTRVESAYQVNKPLREAVVFAQQNLITNAPFSKLDLISCRNLLIYLEPEVQKKIISLLHFALNPGGYLLLGPSETVGRQIDLFEPISKKWRIYRRIGRLRPERVEFPIASKMETSLPMRRLAEPGLSHSMGYAELTQRSLLEEFAPAAVLIDRKYQILYFFGPTTRYLDVPTGVPTQDLMMMVRDGLRTALRSAILKAIREAKAIRLDDAQVKRNGVYCRVAVTIKPLQDPRNPEGLLLVAFQDMSQDVPPSRPPQTVAEESFVRQLEIELKATREDLQSTIEEMESANEELKASNEEVMSMNEELQSTNEELETSKEELQSLNEEISTINNQLNDKVEELESTNNDLANLLNCTDIATVFLDPSLRIKRFTPATTRLLKLIPADVGRPIGDIAPGFTDAQLLSDAARVLRNLTPSDQEIESQDGRWWVRRIAPYRTLDNRIEGVVLTFNDITFQKQAQEVLGKEVENRTADLASSNEKLRQENVEHLRAVESLCDREARLRALLETVMDAIITIDDQGLIQSVNPATEKMFGYREIELIGQNVNRLMPSPYREAHDGYLTRYLQTGEKRIIGIGREVSCRCKDGTCFPADLTVSEMHGDKRLFTGILHDLTRRKQLEREIVEIATAEQRRIGEDLHDNVGQELTALGLLMESLVESIEKHSPADLDLARKLVQGLNRVFGHVRSISRGLVPGEPDVRGLPAALEDLATRVSENAGVRCTFRSETLVEIENDLKARHLYLIAQEACSNALRHGHAKNIAIELHSHDDHFVLTIKDDGSGLPDHPKEGLGLRIMRNRASVIQGALSIEPIEPHGTVVTCTFFEDYSRGPESPR
jgi:two-component system CheB/CheR fusion protein